MQLVVRGAHEKAAPGAREWNPDLRMLELRRQIDVENHEDVVVEEEERCRPSPERIGRGAADDADEERERIRENERIQRMDAEVDERRQHLGRVVRLVQFPQCGNAVLQRVVDEEPEVVSEKERERARTHEREAGRLGAALAQVAREETDDDVVDP